MKVLKILLMSVVGLSFGFLMGCGGSSHSTPTPNVITTTGQNIVPITVDGGPAPPYPDAAFATVTVCVPGTSMCQPIDHMLVDTGSSGVRIVSTVLTVALPQQTSGSTPVAECLQFLGSYTWGPVQTADIQIGGEKASSVPVQVLSDTDFAVPSGCASVGPSADTVQNLGANGILGVGQTAQDCSSSTCPAVANFYYECTSPTAVCTAIAQNTAQQVTNPVSLFAADNNGVIVELPAVTGGVEATVTGSLVLGIGTQSNNALGSATVYTVNTSGQDFLNFNTIFSKQNFTSFLDTGSNGYFFDGSSIPITECPDVDFYCPSSTLKLSATNQGITSGSGTVNFSVANADNLFATPSNNALGNLGGPTSGLFDWGLPFFFGRNVYTAIDGANTPGGVGPYWAY